MDIEPFDAVRAEVRAWVEENFPSGLRTWAAQEQFYQSMPVYPSGPDWDMWKRRLIEKRWTAPGWPIAYGGGGLDPVVADIIATELIKAGAVNPAAGNGATMLAPTLLEFGTDEQKARHVPAVARGEVRWCQGFSEPNAGSDLASLATSAVEDGDDYVVTGQKIWTSDAHHSHWCFCLVRTDRAQRHAGISFLLIDMASPGILVRPIRTISGLDHFCHVFFDGVRVPKANLVGAPGQGWAIAGRLLQFERDPTHKPRRQVAGDTRPLEIVAKTYLGVDDKGGIADPSLRQKVASHLIQVAALQALQARLVLDQAAGSGDIGIISVAKNARARIQQDREELLLEIMGFNALGQAGPGFTEVELDTNRAFLANKAMSIFSGSSEVQNNIIAKRVLGLPAG